MSKKKLAFVVDIKGWAFDIIASHVSEQLSQEYLIKIYYWENYPSTNSLISSILEDKIEHVHFFFREHLKVILDTSNGKDKKIIAFNRLVVTTHIPDYLYNTEVELFERKNLFDFINGYFVINTDLNNVYKQAEIIEKPLSVIFDWPISKPIPKSVNTVNSRKQQINIMWAGNSSWGEHAQHVDYKGYNTVILPAIRRLKSEGLPIKFVVFDSAVKRFPREDVLLALSKNDILLIASEAEGTPLTLIEAMAAGVAVVTTPVGIAPEILDEEYFDYTIVERSADAFYKSIKSLINNREKLSEIQNSNLELFHTFFSENGLLKEKWLSFIKEAQSVKKTVEERAFCYSLQKPYSHRVAIKLARASVYTLKKIALFDVVKSLVPKSAVWYNQLLHGNSNFLLTSSSGSYVYDDILKFYKKILNNNKQKTFIVYSPLWKGVAASSESLFDNGRIRFPYFNSEYPEVDDHPYLDKMVDLIADSKALNIIYSGGSKIHQQMAKKLREKNSKICQFFLWHGSPAQWVEHSQLTHFCGWQNLYDKNNIDGIVCLKPGLDKTLNLLKIKSYALINPIPNLDKYKNSLSVSNLSKNKTQIKLGVFSAISSWYKNPYVQLLAALCHDNLVIHTNIEKHDLQALSLDLKNIKTYEQMPREKFLVLLGSLDINLYITNTECSPMTVMESCALGVPCIVGTAGDIFSSISSELAFYLVEPYVDNPYAIYERINLVLANKERILEILPDFIEQYNEKFTLMKNEFLESIENKEPHNFAVSIS